MVCDCCGAETGRPVVVELGRQRVRRLCRGCFRGDPIRWAGFCAVPTDRGGGLEIALVCVLAAVMLVIYWWPR